MSTKLLLFLTAVTTLAGQQETIDARDLFFSIADLANQPPQRKIAPPARPRPKPHPAEAKADHPIRVVTNPLGLRYALLRRGSTKTFGEISPDSTFRAGDLIRLSVMSNQRGYLYIIQKGSSGAWNPLFPDAQIAAGNNLIEAERKYEIPGGSGEAFRIEGQPGEEKVFILLTRAPETDLDQLIASLKRGESREAPAGIDDAVVERLRNRIGARDLVFAKFDDSADEKAVYVVNQAASGTDARVIVDVTLNHR